MNYSKNFTTFKLYKTSLSVLLYIVDAEERPTMKQLQNVIRAKDIDVTTQWRDLGLELLDSHKVLKEIEANYRNDVNACCRVMFEKWLEVKSDASWNHLVTALKNIKMNTSANAISKLFKSGNCLSCMVYCICVLSY